MRSVLHGTWVLARGRGDDPGLFVWAERSEQSEQSEQPTELPLPSSHSRVRRHPYAATAIEVAHLLDGLADGESWHNSKRTTRVALLPSSGSAPIASTRLDGSNPGVSDLTLHPWRVEGLSVPAPEVLEVLSALHVTDDLPRALSRIGSDLCYWGVVARFSLGLLAQGRFIPTLQTVDSTMHARWRPVLDPEEDRVRFETLARSMPAVCLAVSGERSVVNTDEAVSPQVLLHSFLDDVVDRAAREWSREMPAARKPVFGPAFSGDGHAIDKAWWWALRAKQRHLTIPLSRRAAMDRLQEAWSNWATRTEAAAIGSFRVCFQMEPPDLDTRLSQASRETWVLRYFLQAIDDPSLLVSADQVWREGGEAFSYLRSRVRRPQEELLAGLREAARLSPPIQRSLGERQPRRAVLTDAEAYAFLRETARLLDGAGFGVRVPPWWDKPESPLRIRASLHVEPGLVGNPALGMSAMVAFDWQLALGNEVISRAEFERLADLKTPLIRARGRWVLLQPDQVEAAIAFWEKHRGRTQIPLADALAIIRGAEDELNGERVADVEPDDQLLALLDGLWGEGTYEAVPQPSGLNGQLRPYQVRGLSWLAFLKRWGFGACLADDMGLGKTVQAIALMLQSRSESHDAVPLPSLVICPTSLVGNWRREVERFAPTLRILVHHGSARSEGDLFTNECLGSDLVISTYGLMRRDIEDLIRVRWANVILDEAQNIKNPSTQQARAARRLQGDYRVALTGTPIENHLSELWSIFAYLNPGYLGSQQAFRRTFALPIERDQDQSASARLRELVRPFILRRLKTDLSVIQDLPEKFEYRVYCNLTREQATLYQAAVNDAMSDLQSADRLQHGIQRRGRVLAMLTRLKQICNHPAQFLGDGSDIGQRSGKLNRLREMLDEVLEVGNRALIFTQYAQMGHILQRGLQDAFGQEVLFFHGGTPQKQRDRMLERFQSDADAPAIFVLSLKAGGTGLNLMRANHVFHFDRWWNPAVENQATDRAYRIGQTRDVLVHKFICVGTLEERIDALIESKRALADSVVGQGESWLTELDTSELRDLVALRAEAVEAV